MREGINTEVEHNGRRFHVQTQTGVRAAPVVETLIYHSGQVIVRLTASFAALSDKWRVPIRDTSRLLALQHWEMIHKIKRGMLDEEPDPGRRVPREPLPQDRHPPAPSQTEIVDRETREILAELEAKLERLASGKEDPPPAGRG